MSGTFISKFTAGWHISQRRVFSRGDHRVEDGVMLPI